MAIRDSVRSLLVELESDLDEVVRRGIVTAVVLASQSNELTQYHMWLQDENRQRTVPAEESQLALDRIAKNYDPEIAAGVLREEHRGLILITEEKDALADVLLTLLLEGRPQPSGPAAAPLLENPSAPLVSMARLDAILSLADALRRYARDDRAYPRDIVTSLKCLLHMMTLQDSAAPDDDATIADGLAALRFAIAEGPPKTREQAQSGLQFVLISLAHKGE